tara:strand:+ start:740 stop:949 length:210 start_codon:yes stop_codon:yes gene_type:complete
MKLPNHRPQTETEAIMYLEDNVKQLKKRIMELEVILDDTKIFLKTIGTLKPLVVDNCKRLIKKIENVGI